MFDIYDDGIAVFRVLHHLPQYGFQAAEHISLQVSMSGLPEPERQSDNRIRLVDQPVLETVGEVLHQHRFPDPGLPETQ